MGVIFLLFHGKYDPGGIKLALCEARGRVGKVHPFSFLGGIDLQGGVEAGAKSQPCRQLDAQHTEFQHVGMQGERAVAIEQVADFSGFGKVVVHTLDGDHGLVVSADDEGLFFQGLSVGLDVRIGLQPREFRCIGGHGLAFCRGDFQFRVNVGEERGHEVLESVEHGLCKQVPGTREHLHLGFTIGKQCRPVFLLAYAFAAPVFFLVLWMPLAVIRPLFGFALFVLDKGGSFLFGLGNGQPFEFQPHFLKSFAQALHNMEAIDDDGCFGEALFGNAEL